MGKQFVHSGYARKAGDNYQTVDERCVQALVESIDLQGKLIDICGAQGSAIVNQLQANGYDAEGAPQAFVHHQCNWIVTNPPYELNIVDKFIEHALAHVVAGEALGACFLMRASWDFSQRRSKFFDHPIYEGQVRMRFRPWWTESRVAQPMHNYVWHIWSKRQQRENNPTIIYWPKSEGEGVFRFFKQLR
jgi:hypothetical protein